MNNQNEKKTGKSLFPLIGRGALFSALLLGCVGAFAAAGYFTGFNNIIVWGLGIIPAALFYPGLAEPCLDFFAGKSSEHGKKGFFGAVSKNPAAFLVHGLLGYICFACAAFAAIYYLALGKNDPSFYLMGGIYILFSLLLISIFFYAPMLTVHRKPKLWETYKGAVSLVFSNFPRTLLTLAFLTAIFSPAAAALYFLHGTARLIALAVTVFLYPLPATLIIAGNYSKVSGSKKPLPPAEPENSENQPAEIEFNSDDDYVFVNGKMIKNPNKSK